MGQTTICYIHELYLINESLRLIEVTLLFALVGSFFGAWYLGDKLKRIADAIENKQNNSKSP